MSDLLNSASLVLIPSGYKEDVVYSAVPTDGSGDLSFTRASNGTRVNSAGLVEVCPWNLLEQSEAFSNTSIWNVLNSASVSANTTTAPNGTTTADTLTFSANPSSNIYCLLTPTTGTFTFSIYAKTASGTKQFRLRADIPGGTASNDFTVTTEWQRFEFSVTGTPQTFYIINDSAGTAGSIYIWGAQLNIGATAKPYFPTTDRLNVPRLTYQNGGGGCPSLLLEKQSTNLTLYSQDISNTTGTYWGDGSSGGTATATANYATSPDGTQNATRLQLNQGSLYAVWQQVIGTTSGTTYTYSIWLKAVSGTPTILFLYDGTANQNVTLTNEWVRYTFAFTGGTIAIARFGLWSNVWGTSTTADILAWGAQLEASSYPTSYIPTTSASATRVADACSKTGISSLIGQTEGTLFWDVSNVFQSSGNGARLFLYSNGSNFILISPYGNTLRILILSSGTAFDNFITISGTSLKIAVAYKANDYKFYVNGVSVGTPVATSVPAMSSIGFLDEATGGAVTSQSETNQAALFKTRLTNAQLASLTTL
jgi:hypothetical protein